MITTYISTVSTFLCRYDYDLKDKSVKDNHEIFSSCYLEDDSELHTSNSSKDDLDEVENSPEETVDLSKYIMPTLLILTSVLFTLKKSVKRGYISVRCHILFQFKEKVVYFIKTLDTKPREREKDLPTVVTMK